ncbi:MAG TPA: hypothetical protein VMC80_02130 [Patescibacteria group bacterium]|nr:hypothetical protein [Patescibacteria group bacterium]
MKSLGNRIVGGAEALVGAGIIAAAFVPEFKEAGLTIPLYLVGGAVTIDGAADLISGRCAYLIERTVRFMYHSANKPKKGGMKL